MKSLKRKLVESMTERLMPFDAYASHIMAWNKLNEAISIPKVFQYPFTLEELEYPAKQATFLKKYLGDKVMQIPSYDYDTGKRVKAFKNVETLLKKSTKLETLPGGDMIAYSLPKGTICVYARGLEFEDPCFYFKPSVVLNEGVDTDMAFGIGSTVNYNGKTCKVVSIANGECKLVCGGEVLYTDMDQLKQSTLVN